MARCDPYRSARLLPETLLRLRPFNGRQDSSPRRESG
jgi:hypothetical protein